MAVAVAVAVPALAGRAVPGPARVLVPGPVPGPVLLVVLVLAPIAVPVLAHGSRMTPDSDCSISTTATRRRLQAGRRSDQPADCQTRPLQSSDAVQVTM
jgi:hypothetical protein